MQQLHCKPSDDCEGRLQELAARLQATGLHGQVCAPSLCSAETAFDQRLGARHVARPSLRFCACSEHAAEDYARLKEVRKASGRGGVQAIFEPFGASCGATRTSFELLSVESRVLCNPKSAGSGPARLLKRSSQLGSLVSHRS